MNRLVPLVVLLWSCGTLLGQRITRADKFPVSSAQLDAVLPSALGKSQLRSLTETIGQLGLCVQFPLYKGFGIGGGARATFFAYDPRSFGGTPRTGSAQRWSYYGKVQYEVKTGEASFVEFALRAGRTQYTFLTDSCDDHSIAGAYFNPSVALYLMATKNLAFGLCLGYETDDVVLSAGDFCLDALPNMRRGETDGPIRYFTLGLSVSARFRKADEPQDYY